MNTVILTGNLTKDVEIRYASSGLAVGNVNIACNRKWKDQSGELKEEVSFFGIVIFGKQAETVAEWFKKGSPILVQGRLKQESSDDKQTGKKQSKTVIVMEAFEFMSSRKDSPARLSAGDVAPERPQSEIPGVGRKPVATAAEPATTDDDSIPF